MTAPAKVTSSYGGANKADNALRAIEFAIQELITNGVSASTVTTRMTHFTNDSALITAVVASVTAGRS